MKKTTNSSTISILFLFSLFLFISSCARLIPVDIPGQETFNRRPTSTKFLRTKTTDIVEAVETSNEGLAALIAEIKKPITSIVTGPTLNPNIKTITKGDLIEQKGNLSSLPKNKQSKSTPFRESSRKNKKTNARYLSQSYRYAMACSNAYKHGVHANHQFKITGWKRVARYENRLGSAADVYETSITNEVVIAFRGTEFLTAKDWIFGNFNVLYPGQYKEAHLLFELVRHRYGNKTKIVTTGHSLGAGLALSCARKYPDVDAIVFDASPRVFSYARFPSTQIHIVEKGEILTIVRTIWRTIPPNTFDPSEKYTVDYLTGKAIQQHNMYDLANTMLEHAATQRNFLDAQRIVADNK